MVERSANAAACRKVELAIGGLDGLSVPPCVAVQYLSKILEGRFSPSFVGDIVGREPALAAAILALAARRGAGPVEQRHAVSLVMDRLDADEARDTLLGIKVSAGFEIEFAARQPASPVRTDLILHSLGVACCAQSLAEHAVPEADARMAYSAGLLHDIGKLALQDIMPRSLAAIAQEAEATRTSLYTVEQKHLGTNHAMLGKLLAQKWRLPEPIAMAIWLHHSDAVTRLDDLAETQVARLVWAADHIVRDAGIGESGSFSEPESLSVIARMLGTDVATLEHIRDDVSQELPEKAESLGLDMPNATARYCDTIHAVAATLSTKHTALSEAHRALQTASTYLDFAREFLLHTGPSAGAIDVAADLARRWQRFFQTGSVCLYLEDGGSGGTVDAVIVEALGHSHEMVLEPPDGMSAIPRAVSERFAMLDAQVHLGWLAEQVDVDFDMGRTKLVPLLADGGAVAALAFELNLPGDAALFAEKFEMAASMAGTVLGLAVAKERQMHFSERLIQAMGHAAAVAAEVPETKEEERPTKSPLAVLAEMAAGVAHELNNPLSVISGRAQLLVQDEDNEARQKDLNRIQENARAVAEIIDDLMSFAEPSTPRPARTDMGQIIEEAVELAGQKSGVDHVNAQVQTEGDTRSVFVDSGQVVSALANVISNAIESYSDNLGPVKILIEPGATAVCLRISDLGCGMDAETLEKATHPFFSAKPAGRQRGMGLAYATRLIQINGGTLTLESELEQGTTVTVTLPYE